MPDSRPRSIAQLALFKSHQEATGTQYTTTTALLILAFIVSPLVLILSGPFEYVPAALALATSALSAALARLSWRRHSLLTIPSMEAPPVPVK